MAKLSLILLPISEKIRREREGDETEKRRAHSWPVQVGHNSTKEKARHALEGFFLTAVVLEAAGFLRTRGAAALENIVHILVFESID